MRGSFSLGGVCVGGELLVTLAERGQGRQESGASPAGSGNTQAEGGERPSAGFGSCLQQGGVSMGTSGLTRGFSVPGERKPRALASLMLQFTEAKAVISLLAAGVR